MSELGQILRELRGKRSLREVADATGLSHSYIADVEKGYRRGSKTPLNPSPETLKRLSEAYDYSYEELMKKAGYLPEEIELANQPHKDDDETPLTPKEEQEWIQIAKELSKDESLFFYQFHKAPNKKKRQLIKYWEHILMDDED